MGPDGSISHVFLEALNVFLLPAFHKLLRLPLTFLLMAFHMHVKNIPTAFYMPFKGFCSLSQSLFACFLTAFTMPFKEF